MDSILHLITDDELKIVHRIITDRYTDRLSYSNTNLDELNAVKEEVQRRIDVRVNPFDKLTTKQYAN